MRLAGRLRIGGAVRRVPREKIEPITGERGASSAAREIEHCA
jgi:hypothetical protein